MPIAQFIDDIPTYEVREGNMHIVSPDRSWTIPLRIFRVSVMRALAAVRVWDEHRAQVVHLRKRKKKKGKKRKH